MNEGTIWLVGVVLSLFTVCGFGTYSSVKDNETMLEMVKAGSDPQKAACAVRGSTELNKQVCHVIAAK